MTLEVKIEIRSTVKKITTQPADDNTHNFTVFVQGQNGNQIEHFVQQVVFYLPFNSPDSKQVKSKPPYLISGCANVSFRLPIDVFFQTSDAHNKVRYSYYVYLPDKPVETAVKVKTLTLLNTPQDFKERLLLGGAEAADSEKNVEHLECKTESTEPSDIQNEIHNELSNTGIQNKDIFEQNGSFFIQEVYSFDELMKENEILKKENEILLNKFNKQAGIIASYVEKLPVLQDNFSAVNTEFGELQKKTEANEAEISNLKSSIQTLMSQINQRNNEVDEDREQMKRRKKATVLNSSSDSESFPGLIPIAEIFLLNSKEQNLEHPNVMEISQGDNSSNKEPHNNIFSQPIEDEEHRNSSRKEKNPISNVLNTGFCQNEEKSQNCGKDKVQVFSSSQKSTEVAVLSSKRKTVNKNQISPKENSLKKKPLEKISNEKTKKTFKEKEPQPVSQKQMKNKVNGSLTYRNNSKFINLSYKERSTMSSNCENISAENNSLQKDSTERLSMKATQESVKGGLQANSNQQKIDQIVSNLNHSVNMKRTIFLPIPEARKRHCSNNQNLDNVKQRTMCSVPGSARTVDKQLCLPAKTSSVAITTGDETYSIPVQIKNSALNSVYKNLLPTAGTNSNESDSTSTNPNVQLQKRTKIEGFKKRKSESVSSNTIESILKDIDDRLICSAKQNYYAHLLTEFLTNPSNCPDISVLIFLVIDHLRQTTKNYLEAFRKEQTNCIFLPSSESCIVSALFEIEKKFQTYSQLKLVQNILTTIYHLLLSAKDVDVHGFASLCRVFTEICKRKGDLLKPLSLSVELLKKKRLFSPYLIASVVGIWREPFMLPSDQSEEAMILLGSVSMGARKRTKRMDDSTWLCSAELISEYFPFPSLPDIKVAINFLKKKIISNCSQNSHEKSSMLTSSLTILASLQHWEWTRKHVIDGYIIPNLSKYANEQPNEKAFALFCDLCVNVNSQLPCMKHSVLRKYFVQTPNKGHSFVKEWATISLAKYLLLTRQPLRHDISEWLDNNQDKSSVKEFKDFFLRKNMYIKSFKSSSDIVIT